MLFKGFNFKKSKDIVQLPSRDMFGNVMPYVKEGESYIVFGRIVKNVDPKNLPSGVYPTNFRMSDTGEIVFAKVIPSAGHSLTNMMYGQDGSVYLAKDGYFFKAKINP